MKRVQLVLDQTLLRDALQVFGARDYSEAVNRALEEASKIQRVNGLSEWFGSDIWQGCLSEMRQDLPKELKKKKQASR